MDREIQHEPASPWRGSPRDFHGYGGRPPRLPWPGDARVAVSFVVNFEEGAELSVADGDAGQETVYEATGHGGGIADPCIDSHFEYGTRVAYWRVMDVLDRFGATATLSACGRAAERSPWLVRDAIRRGHEVAAHGDRWLSHGALAMPEDEVRRDIARAVRAITAAAGTPPVGWHTRSAASPFTRQLLQAQGGFLYDSDAYNDDTPYFVRVGERPHLVLPYAFDSNDMQFQHSDRFVRAADFAGYVCDAFDWLWREGEQMPRMLSIGLHTRIIGRPGRIAALEMILRHMAERGGAWLASRAAIARHWWAACPDGRMP